MTHVESLRSFRSRPPPENTLCSLSCPSLDPAAAGFLCRALGRALLALAVGRRRHYPCQRRPAMALSGDWVTLKVDGIRYLEKPPLPYWLAAADYHIFGYNVFATHLPLTLGVLALAILGLGLGPARLRRPRGVLCGPRHPHQCRAFFSSRASSSRKCCSPCCCLCPLQFSHRTGRREAGALIPCLGCAGAGHAGQGTGCPGLLLLQPPSLTCCSPAIGAAGVNSACPPAFCSSSPSPRPGTSSPGCATRSRATRLGNIPSPRATSTASSTSTSSTSTSCASSASAIRIDYNKLPCLLYWSLHLVWLFPWSLYLPVVLRRAWTTRARWWTGPPARLAIPSLRASAVFRGRTNWLLAIYAAVILVFFSLSTNQEYYTFPAYFPCCCSPPVALASEESEPGAVSKWLTASPGGIRCARHGGRRSARLRPVVFTQTALWHRHRHASRRIATSPVIRSPCLTFSISPAAPLPRCACPRRWPRPRCFWARPSPGAAPAAAPLRSHGQRSLHLRRLSHRRAYRPGALRAYALLARHGRHHQRHRWPACERFRSAQSHADPLWRCSRRLVATLLHPSAGSVGQWPGQLRAVGIELSRRSACADQRCRPACPVGHGTAQISLRARGRPAPTWPLCSERAAICCRNSPRRRSTPIDRYSIFSSVAGKSGVISTEVVMRLRPTQGDEKRLLSGKRSLWKRRPPLCHPERSRGICSVRGPFLEMFFDRAYLDFLRRGTD